MYPNPNFRESLLRRDAAFLRWPLKACNSRATLFKSLAIDVRLYIDVQQYVFNRIIVELSDLRLQSALSVSRSLSTHSLSKHSQRIKTAWRASPSVTQSGATAQASRFSSTASTASPTSISSGATEPFAASFDDYNTSSIEEITSDLPLIPETIGYLKDLGLDFGWGPTALVEYLLEHIHVYTATPWWASIGLMALVIRLALLKPYIDSADVSARVATIAEVQKPIKARLDAAKAARDQTKVMQASQEMLALHRQAGIRIWKVAVPLLQLPIGFGMFRLLRRMTELPVPGLEDGGLLWLKDLTMSDPYFILPALTGLGIYYTVKVVSCRQF